MNNKNLLLAETLGDGDGQRFARIAAGHTRRRRAAKRLAAGALMAAVVIAVLLTARPSVPRPASLAGGSSPSLEIISDEELLAQLKGEAILVLKDRTGITGIVFLADNTRSASHDR